jgi:hypothetical protein
MDLLEIDTILHKFESIVDMLAEEPTHNLTNPSLKLST